MMMYTARFCAGTTLSNVLERTSLDDPGRPPPVAVLDARGTNGFGPNNKCV
jgi:hypothetical protein